MNYALAREHGTIPVHEEYQVFCNRLKHCGVISYGAPFHCELRISGHDFARRIIQPVLEGHIFVFLSDAYCGEGPSAVIKNRFRRNADVSAANIIRMYRFSIPARIHVNRLDPISACIDH